MENKDTRWKLRFENYLTTLANFDQIIPADGSTSEFEKYALVQRFEFAFDLSWKVMQDYLKYVGYFDIRGPRPCIMQMAQDGLIDPFVWEELLNARNESGDSFDDSKNQIYFDKIVNDFLPVLREFKDKMVAKQ